MPAVLVLQSWKQIANYIGRTERTLRRWEREFDFPVHRPSGTARSSVMALPEEIQEWTRGKPSLVQIRGSARLNRAKFTLAPAALFPALSSSNKYSSDGVPAFTEAQKLRHEIKLERLRQSALIAEQKKLREDVHHLRNEQRDLLASLEKKSRKSKGNQPGTFSGLSLTRKHSHP